MTCEKYKAKEIKGMLERHHRDDCGYGYNFLSEPDVSLECLICLAVARDPRQHEECGKLFCSECIEKYGTDEPCPYCKQTGANFYKVNKSKYKLP